MGQVAFSPELQLASRKINAWLLLEKKAKGMRMSSRYLSRTLRKASIPIASRSASLDSIGERLKSVYQEYYSVRIYYIYYVIRSNAADGQRTADG